MDDENLIYNIGLCSQFAYKILDEGARLLRLLEPILLSHDRSINELALHNRNNFQHNVLSLIFPREERSLAWGLREIIETCEHDRHTTIFTFYRITSYNCFSISCSRLTRKRKKEKEKNVMRGKEDFFE